MKKTAPKRKPAGKENNITMTLKPSEHVFNLLTSFRKRFMPNPGSNEANAANCLLLTALINYDHTMARERQIEAYCIAEGIEDQGEYRESILRAKFPRGRVPRPKAVR